MSAKKQPPAAKNFERQAPPMPRLAEQLPAPAPDAANPEAAEAKAPSPRSDRDLIMRLVELVKAL